MFSMIHASRMRFKSVDGDSDNRVIQDIFRDDSELKKRSPDDFHIQER